MRSGSQCGGKLVTSTRFFVVVIVAGSVVLLLWGPRDIPFRAETTHLLEVALSAFRDGVQAVAKNLTG